MFSGWLDHLPVPGHGMRYMGLFVVRILDLVAIKCRI